MYKITYIHKDETEEYTLYDPEDQKYTLTYARLDLAMGQSGDLNISIPEDNPAYNDIVCLTDEIIVYRDGEELWRGRSVTLQTDFYRTGTLDCEGILSYLHDTYYHPFEFPFDGENGDPKILLQDIIDNHNAQVGDDTRKILTLGMITVEDPNNYIARSSIYYLNTMEALQEKFINDSLGGYFRIRVDGDTRYLDYLDNYNPNGETAEQAIEFGENLLDMAQSLSYSDTASVILPLGAKIQDEEGLDTDEYTTIESVNGGSVYFVDEALVKQYGWICVSVTWDDVTLPSNLLEHAKLYLAQVSGAVASFTVNAVDLSLAGGGDKAWNVGDMIRIYSRPHNINQYAELSSMSLDLLNPEVDTYQFGGDTTSMTGSTRNAQRDLETSLGSLAVRLDNLSVNIINAVYANIEHLIAETITAEYIWSEVADLVTADIENLIADKASIEDLEAVTADIDSLTVIVENVEGVLEATVGEFADLSAITAQVVTLLGGDITTGEITSIYLSADTTVIDTAIITNALIGTILADLLEVGYIDTNMIHIGSEDGTLMIDDSTILIYDSDGNPRIQIGLDASGDYNLALWDADGNCMWNASGVTEYGINDGVIRDDMVADDAAIQGSKLDIASVAECLNADGSLILQASQVYIGDEGLSIVLAQMQQQIDSIDPSEYEKYGICDVVDWFCLSDDGENPPDLPVDTRAYAEIFRLGVSILGSTEVTGEWTTERLSSDSEHYLWTVTEYICYDGTIIWGTARCMTDRYVRESTSVLLQEFEVMDGYVKSLISQVTTIEGDVEGITNDFNLFYQDYEETINTISSSVALATEDASYARETADNLVITVNEFQNTITDEVQILVGEYELIWSDISYLYQSNTEIYQGLVHVEELIEGLETDGLLDFQAYYALSDSPDVPPDGDAYDDRAYAAIFALGVSILGNTENSSAWTTEKLTGAEGINLLSLYESYSSSAVIVAASYVLSLNAYGRQYAGNTTVTLSFDARVSGEGGLNIENHLDGSGTLIAAISLTDEWTHYEFTFDVADLVDNPSVYIYNGEWGNLRYFKLEVGSKATDFNTGTSLKYVWIRWRKVHVDGSVTWTDPELLTDAYVNAQWSYIHEEINSIDMQVGTVLETIDGVTTQVADLYIDVNEIKGTVESLATTVDGFDERIAQVEVTAEGVYSTVQHITEDADSIEWVVTRFTQTDNSISLVAADLDATNQQVAQLEIDLNSITMQVTSGVDGGAIMKLVVGEADETYGRNLLLGTYFLETTSSTDYYFSDFAIENAGDKMICLRFKVRGTGNITVRYYRTSSSYETWLEGSVPPMVDGEYIDADIWSYWEYKSSSMDAPTSSSFVRITIDGTVSFAEVKLEFLDTTNLELAPGTSWTPAPEDDLTEFAMDVRQYFANSNSVVYIGAGVVEFAAGTFLVSSTTFNVTRESVITSSDALDLVGTMATTMEAGKVEFSYRETDGLDTAVIYMNFVGEYVDDEYGDVVALHIEADDIFIGEVKKARIVVHPEYIYVYTTGELGLNITGNFVQGRGTFAVGGESHFYDNAFFHEADIYIEKDKSRASGIYGQPTVAGDYERIIGTQNDGITAVGNESYATYIYSADRVAIGNSVWANSNDGLYIGSGSSVQAVWMPGTNMLGFGPQNESMQVYVWGSSIYLSGRVYVGDRSLQAIFTYQDMLGFGNQDNPTEVYIWGNPVYISKDLRVSGDIYGNSFFGKADSAYTADNATNADFAAQADYATSAGTADTAVSADTAGYASSADYAVRLYSENFSYSYAGINSAGTVFVGSSGTTPTVNISADEVDIGESVSSAAVRIYGGSIQIGYSETTSTITLNCTAAFFDYGIGRLGYAAFITTSKATYMGPCLEADDKDETTPDLMLLSTYGAVCISASSDIALYGTTVTVYGTFNNQSDKTMKTDIAYLEKAEDIDDLKPVSFKWKDHDDGHTHYGYIAQDVQEVCPELVYEDRGGSLSLAYTEIIPLLHLKIKSLEERIKQLESANS